MHKKSDASWGRLPWWKAAKICKKRTKLSWHFVFSFSFFRVRAYLIYKTEVILTPWQWHYVFSLDRCSAGDCSA